MTLISAPVARKSVENEWRNVCQPIRRLILSFTAVGRMTLRIRDWRQYGRRPWVFGLAKTQSSSDLCLEEGFGNVPIEQAQALKCEALRQDDPAVLHAGAAPGQS
jgi:hypothetical protein